MTNDPVRPVPPSYGRPREVADNLYSIRLPMPYGLDHINTYLIKETNRLALVDTGLDLPDSWTALQEGFRRLNIRPDDLTDIFVTHAHPDHIGQLPALRRFAPGARLWMHRQEYGRLAERAADRPKAAASFQVWLARHGETFLDAARLAAAGLNLLPTLASGDRLLDGGEQIRLEDREQAAAREWQVYWTPGHTAGHFVLFQPEQRLLLSGDHLLTSISSNIGKYPGSTDDPLGDYIASLETIRALPVERVLPAHGEPFQDHRRRIDDLIGHHRARLDRIYATLEGGPRTAAEVVQAIWADRATGFHRYLALVEALSHLERLRREGQVEVEDDGPLTRFRAA